MRIPGNTAATARSASRLSWRAVMTVAVCIAGGAALWFVLAVLRDLPDAATLRNAGAMAQATVAFDRHDQPAFTIFREQRIKVPLDRISPHLISAILAVEDQRFYDHGGVDTIRIAGAALSNLRQGRAAQGGSTLTQQLARQTFLTTEKTIRRKLKEAVLALRLEGTFTKAEILELYLDKVYFGDGLYGAEAASLGYFGKHAADLDVSDAALLAGLVKAPSAYAPTVDLERAVERRNLVLLLMRDAGAVDEETYASALAKTVRLTDGLRPADTDGQYFREEVRKQLVARFGTVRVNQGGLRVYTTLDPAAQHAAEREVARALAAIERRQGPRRNAADERDDDPLQAALVALDPATGEVLAMVGGRDFARSRFNRAMQARRQPGSAFKPFVYATALEQGYSAATMISGLDVPVATARGAWVPDDEHGETDSLTMRTALTMSSNRAAVRMLQDVGIPATLHLGRQLGLGSLPGVPSLALGSGEVTLLAMTRAFAAFANGGVVTVPTLIRRVESAEGGLLYEATRDETRVLTATTAFILTSMLADVVDAGTGGQVRQVGFTKPAAGKTGTTNDFHDAWFVGYTPHLAAGVWVGYDRPRTIMANGYASQLAVPLWGRFMATAAKNDPPTLFAPPATVVPLQICRISGMIARDSCRHVDVITESGNRLRESTEYTEYFAPGTEPVGLCPLHKRWSFSSLFARGAGTPAPTAPPATPDAGVPAAPPAGSPSLAALVPESDEDAPPRKRGFWSRLFGPLVRK
jgi:1A family penicillin-binding protein